jgi:putative Mn2+ efflux pump MntP
VTGGLSLVGLRLGSRLGARFGKRMEIAGGLILVLIGLRIVLLH